MRLLIIEDDRRLSSGLGLAITQSIAETHGGDVHIQSGVGRGAVVEIWLPTS